MALKQTTPNLETPNVVSSIPQIRQSTYLAEGIKALGEGALSLHKGKFLAEGERDIKTLRDEFVGKELVDIDEQLLERERTLSEGARGPITEESGVTVTPTDPLSAEDIQNLEEEIQYLRSRRAGVRQGVISNDEFKVRAEARYYQALARAPGYAPELKKIYGEVLGFSPEAQRVGVTMANNLSTAEAQSKAQTKAIDLMRKELVANDVFDPTRPVQEQYLALQPVLRKMRVAQEAVTYLENLKKRDDLTDLSSQKEAFNTWYPDIKASEHQQMRMLGQVSYQGELINLDSMNVRDVLKLDEADKTLMIQQIKRSVTARTDYLKEQKALFNHLPAEQEKIQALIDQLEGRSTLYQDYINGTDYEKMLDTKENVLDTLNKIAISQAASSLLDYKDTPSWVALSQLFGNDSAVVTKIFNEENQIHLTNRILQGDGYTGAGVDGDDKKKVYDTFKEGLSRLNIRLNSGAMKPLDKNQSQFILNQLKSLNKSDVEDLDPKLTKHVITLASNDTVIKSLQQHHSNEYPQVITKFRRTVGDYTKNYREDLLDRVNSAKPTQGKATFSPYYLKKESGSQFSIDVTDQALSENRDRYVLEKVPQALNIHNLEDINQIIKSTMNLYNVSPDQAARIVAQDFGFSVTNKKPAHEAQETVPRNNTESGPATPEPEASDLPQGETSTDSDVLNLQQLIQGAQEVLENGGDSTKVVELLQEFQSKLA